MENWQKLSFSYHKKILSLSVPLLSFTGVLYFIGSTVNPILYNVMSRRFRRAFTETICQKPFTNRHSNGHTSWKQQREKDSKLRLVEHRNWEHNHLSYTSDQNGLTIHADIDETHKTPEMNGINTCTPDDSSNCAFTNTAESTQQTSYKYKAKTGSKCNSIQGRKILHVAIMTGKNKDLGIYV